MRQFYGLIHKHHHRQKAPSRGNIDAINVHPFEFAVGEYLHLLTVYLIPCHIYTVAFFVLAGGILFAFLSGKSAGRKKERLGGLKNKIKETKKSIKKTEKKKRETKKSLESKKKNLDTIKKKTYKKKKVSKKEAENFLKNFSKEKK